MTTSRERAFLFLGAALAIAALVTWVLGWTQSGCGFSGCVPGGSTNAVQYNATGSFGGTGPGTAITVLHGNASAPPSFGAVDLMADVTNQLPMGSGGTGVSTAAANQLLVSSGSAWNAVTVPDCTSASGNHLNYAQGTGSFGCSASSTGILSGTTGSIGGGLLAVGGCTSGTVSVTGASTSMVAMASPNTYPGDGIWWDAQVTSSNTVTVKVCVAVLSTPTAGTYNVRVIP